MSCTNTVADIPAGKANWVRSNGKEHCVWGRDCTFFHDDVAFRNQLLLASYTSIISMLSKQLMSE